MKIITTLKNFRWGYLLLSVVLCLVGICFVIFPSQSLRTVSYVIAAVTIIFGIVGFVKVLADRKRGFAFAISTMVSALTAICGIVAAIIPDEVIKVYPMFIGLFVIIDGSFKLQTVINAKRYKLKMWWFLLVLSVLTIATGFLAVRTRFSEDNARIFTAVLGISVFLCGLENFFSLFYLDKIVKSAVCEYEMHAKISDDVINADSYISDSQEHIKQELLPNDDSSVKLQEPSDSDLEENFHQGKGKSAQNRSDSNDK